MFLFGYGCTLQGRTLGHDVFSIVELFALEWSARPRATASPVQTTLVARCCALQTDEDVTSLPSRRRCRAVRRLGRPPSIDHRATAASARDGPIRLPSRYVDHRSFAVPFGDTFWPLARSARCDGCTAQRLKPNSITLAGSKPAPNQLA